MINNNNNGSLSEAAADLNSLKRRSYIPQDYLSQVLDPTTSADIAAALATSSRLKRKDFPKVIKDKVIIYPFPFIDIDMNGLAHLQFIMRSYYEFMYFFVMCLRNIVRPSEY